MQIARDFQGRAFVEVIHGDQHQARLRQRRPGGDLGPGKGMTEAPGDTSRQGLDNCAEMLRRLIAEQTAIKVQAEVGED